VISWEPIVLQSASKTTTRYVLFSYSKGASYMKTISVDVVKLLKATVGDPALGWISQSKSFAAVVAARFAMNKADNKANIVES
jgi:hypothetical protein